MTRWQFGRCSPICCSLINFRDWLCDDSDVLYATFCFYSTKQYKNLSLGVQLSPLETWKLPLQNENVTISLQCVSFLLSWDEKLYIVVLLVKLWNQRLFLTLCCFNAALSGWITILLNTQTMEEQGTIFKKCDLFLLFTIPPFQTPVSSERYPTCMNLECMYSFASSSITSFICWLSTDHVAEKNATLNCLRKRKMPVKVRWCR